VSWTNFVTGSVEFAGPTRRRTLDGSFGVDLRFSSRICSYWRNAFDWKLQVESLSAFHHYRYESDGLGIHFIHERGKGPSPVPLILTHGWPGSSIEMNYYNNQTWRCTG
jgi:pimeloyl-ACP methyl ester carboxylesterase